MPTNRQLSITPNLEPPIAHGNWTKSTHPALQLLRTTLSLVGMKLWYSRSCRKQQEHIVSPAELSLQMVTDAVPLCFYLFLMSIRGANRWPLCRFKFELGWLLPDSLMDMVKEAWENVDLGSTLMERWQAKIRRFRQHLWGYAKNTSGALKKEKKKNSRQNG